MVYDLSAVQQRITYYHVKLLCYCTECFSKFSDEYRDGLKKKWLDDLGIDYCIYCDDQPKLVHELKVSEGELPLYDPLKEYKMKLVPFVHWEVKCPKCDRSYSPVLFLFNGPQSEWKDISEIVKPQPDVYANHIKYSEYAKGTKAEDAGRYDDAANHFEAAGFLTKAKSLREKNRVFRHEHRHISFDVNQMIDALGKTNFTIPYKCPNCGAVIKLNKDRDANSFMTCEYCNTGLKAVDIEGLIKQCV